MLTRVVVSLTSLIKFQTFVKSHSIICHCIVWSSVSVCCLPLNIHSRSCACGRQWYGIFHNHWWTAAIEPSRLCLSCMLWYRRRFSLFDQINCITFFMNFPVATCSHLVTFSYSKLNGICGQWSVITNDLTKHIVIHVYFVNCYESRGMVNCLSLN